MPKTIRELADEFNVSKQAVRKRLTDEFRSKYVETVYSNGVQTLVVTVSGYILLKQHFSSGNVAGNGGNIDVGSDSKKITGDGSVFKILEQQLAVKDKQLENKDLQISQIQNLLDQQQRLTLQDKQLLEKYKAEIKDLKASTMTSRDVEKDVSQKIESEQKSSTEEPHKKNKRWYQFWK